MRGIWSCPKCGEEMEGPEVRRGLEPGSKKPRVAWGAVCTACGWSAVGYGSTMLVASQELGKQIRQAGGVRWPWER